MATATDQNPNQTKVPGVAKASHPSAGGGGNSEPEVGKSAPGWQQALAGNYKQVCSHSTTAALRCVGWLAPSDARSEVRNRANPESTCWTAVVVPPMQCVLLSEYGVSMPSEQQQTANNMTPHVSCFDRVQSAKSPTDGWDFPKLGLRGLQNFLKLRTRHRFNDRLTADLGVDINALNQAIIPRAALSYQVPSHCTRLCSSRESLQTPTG